MNEKSVVGDLINFRGLVYSPINEQGVVFLFGKIMDDLNIYIEEIKADFPDCIARRYIGKGKWERIRVEFEFLSKNFKLHHHDPNECDMIVCWEHNWEDCTLEVLELKEEIQGLENYLIERPDLKTKNGKDIQEFEVSNHIKKIIDELFIYVKTFSNDVWIKIVKNGYTIYSPERVFIYVNFRKEGVYLVLFTREEEMEGVKSAVVSGGGHKWGKCYIYSIEDLEKYKPVLKRSFDLIKEAISCGETTGWRKRSEEDIEDIEE